MIHKHWHNSLRLGWICGFLSIACAFMGSIHAAEGSRKVTFSHDVAKIIHSRCVSCHRSGQNGPFELVTYDDVKSHASTIAAVIESGYMPPWKPVATGIEFANHRSLSSEERMAIESWIASGCPQGDASETPKPPEFPNGWSLGQPDLIVRMSEPFQVPASGPDIYRSFVFPVNLPDDKWIKAMELRPTARTAVHHALFFADEAGQRRTKDKDGQPGFRGMSFLGSRGTDILERGPDRLARGLGGYVPGTTPNRLPGDLARLLPKGCDIVMQTHFHPSGKAETEQAELALYFTDQPPSHLLTSIQLPPVFGAGAGIQVPAGEANYRIEDRYTLPIDVLAHEIGGHAHYICREMTMTARLPDGKELTLLQIDDWDLDWQDQYAFAQPIALPKGTELKAVIVYDNSANNPENPYSPPRQISWGRESNDEMGSITLLTTAVNERERPELESQMRERSREALKSRVRGQMGSLSMLSSGGRLGNGILKLLDRNRDGKLQESEMPERSRDRMLEFLDRNDDGVIDQSEIDQSRDILQRFIDQGPRSGKGR